jgi:hypothetical protein
MSQQQQEQQFRDLTEIDEEEEDDLDSMERAAAPADEEETGHADHEYYDAAAARQEEADLRSDPASGGSTGFLDQRNTTQDSSYLYFGRTAASSNEDESYFFMSQQQQSEEHHHLPKGENAFPSTGEDTAATVAAVQSPAVPGEKSSASERVNTTSSTIYVGAIIYSDLSEDADYGEGEDEDEEVGRSAGSANGGELRTTTTPLPDDAAAQSPVGVLAEQQTAQEQLGIGDESAVGDLGDVPSVRVEQATQTGSSLEDDDDDDDDRSGSPPADLHNGQDTGTLHTQTRVTQSSPQNLDKGRRERRFVDFLSPTRGTRSTSHVVQPFILHDIESQHGGGNVVQGEIDGNSSTGTSSIIHNSAFDVVDARSMRREKRCQRKRSRQTERRRMPFPELPYVDAKMDRSESSHNASADNDSSDFVDARSNLSDDGEDIDGAMAWTGTHGR